MTSPSPSHAVRAVVPPLASERHKGEAGRVGVLGGSVEYTGASYFAALSAMRCGADLAHVFCCAPAAPVIKGYSPELIVHPLLPVSNGGSEAELSAAAASAAERIREQLGRLDCLVVGPGLGRDAAALETAARVAELALRTGLVLVLDGDGLHLLISRPSLRQACVDAAGPVVLTPNVNEYRRLAAALGCEAEAEGEAGPAALSARLGNAVLVRKGAVDVVACGAAPPLLCDSPGSLRRCGGQGDVLAGVVGLFVAWAAQARRAGERQAPSAQMAAYAACCVARAAAKAAFGAKGRSMLAGDVLAEVGQAAAELAKQR